MDLKEGVKYPLKGVAILAVLGGCSLSVQATIIDLNNYAESSTGEALNNFSTTNSSSNPLLAESNSFYSALDGSFADSTGRMNSAGWFYNRSAGGGTFGAETITRQIYSVSNGNIAQAFDFDFTLLAGSLNVSCHGDGGFIPSGANLQALGANTDAISPDQLCLTGNEVSAGYQAEILLNGNSIWGSSFEMTLNDLGLFSVFSGTQLGSSPGDSTLYNWGEQSFNISLGDYDPNEAFTLEYSVRSYVEGVQDNGNCFFGDDFGTCTGGGAQYGDPNVFPQSQIAALVANPTGQVPEPSTFLILLAGIGALLRFKRS